MLSLATAALWLVAADVPRPATVDFRRDVYPILKNICFDCHQGRRASSGVRLDVRGDILGETTGKPLAVAGKSAASRLIHLISEAPGKRMPKAGPALTDAQIKLLRAWIDEGLAWDDRLLPPDTAADHWAFRPVARPRVPAVHQTTWVRNPVDAFILAKLEESNVPPAPQADVRTLVRRVHFDLTGLPPTSDEIDAASHQDRMSRSSVLGTPYSVLIDRLLASPHYGERWGRHWLDVARWAESEGYESNHPRSYAWRYRDWVVRAFNDDKPFADFVREQLAGDEISPYADAHLIATGFLASARLSSNEEDRPRQRNDILIDIVNTTASAFLGLTVHCAQCHNHKFDPITARDYYRLQGFFVQGQPGNFALRDPALGQAYAAKKATGYDEAVAERDRLYETARARKVAEVRQTLSGEAAAVYALAMEQRSPAQEKLARQTDLLFQFSGGQIENALSADERKRYGHLKQRIAELEKGMIDRPQTFAFYSPATSPHRIDVLPMKGFYPLTYDPADLKRAKPYLLAAGDVHQPSFVVEAGWPALFGPTPRLADRPRLALATWLTDPRHPLTPRVWVNRVWQQHFGRGLVASTNDFGVKGAPPTHPELLDWLTAEFIESGGSTKHLHRLILTSSTYRQSAQASKPALDTDPDNELWSRWQPHRLEAEAIRDAWLAVSGALDRSVGGASVPPDDKATRRSLYLFQKREAPPAQQALFDGPFAMTESCGRRLTTTVALQSLYLLNSGFSMQRAEALAHRVAAVASKDRDERISAAFRLTLQRAPTPHERELAWRFFEQHGGADTAALTQFCQALMNVNEFVYLE